MSHSEMTLRNLFSFTEGGLHTEAVSVLGSNHAILAMKTNVLDQMKGLQWSSVLVEIASKINDLLDFNLVDVLATAWSKSQALSKYTDRDRYPPDETILLPLAEHTVKSKHHPYVEILVGEMRVAKVLFEVALALTLKAFVLKIQDAKIKAIQTGSLRAKATIALEQAVIAEKILDPIPLPGTIDLGEGVAILGAIPFRGERRKESRLPMKLPVLVRGPRGEQEITKTENVSKGGVAVPLSMHLEVGDILKIMCPYTPGGENIEENTQVRRRANDSSSGQGLYGLCYLRETPSASLRS